MKSLGSVWNIPFPPLVDSATLLLIMIPLAVWSYFWKIVGLWFSAKKNEKAWFIVFVFVNLAGFLELYYLHSRKCWPFSVR